MPRSSRLGRVLAQFATAAVGGYAVYGTYSWHNFFKGKYDDEFGAAGDGVGDPSMAGILKSWYDLSGTIRERHDVRPALTGDGGDFDVCVIGGGVAGLHAAISLSERGKRCALVEARRLGSGGSGRNGGQLLAAFHAGTDEIADLCGEEIAKQMFDDTIVYGTERTVALIKKYGIQCDLQRSKVLVVNFKNSAVKAGMTVAEAVAKEQKESDDWFRRFGEEWTAVDTAGLAANGLSTPRFTHGKYSEAGACLNPLELVFGLARVLETLQSANKIFEHSPVTKVVREPPTSDGHASFVVETGGGAGRLRAKEVVIATGTAPACIAPHLTMCSAPMSTALMVTKPFAKEALDKVLGDRAVIYDERIVMAYWRRVGGDRILFGSLASGSPLPKDYMVTELTQEFKQTFPTLAADVEIDRLWQGPIHMRFPMAPLIGYDGASQCWYSLAFGGHGLAASAAAGERIAQAIVESETKPHTQLAMDETSPAMKALRAWTSFTYVDLQRLIRPSWYLPPSLPIMYTFGSVPGSTVYAAWLRYMNLRSGHHD